MRFLRWRTVLETISGVAPKTTRGSARMRISHRSQREEIESAAALEEEEEWAG
jgi:hypothetical protein